MASQILDGKGEYGSPHYGVTESGNGKKPGIVGHYGADGEKRGAGGGDGELHAWRHSAESAPDKAPDEYASPVDCGYERGGWHIEVNGIHRYIGSDAHFGSYIAEYRGHTQTEMAERPDAAACGVGCRRSCAADIRQWHEVESGTDYGHYACERQKRNHEHISLNGINGHSAKYYTCHEIRCDGCADCIGRATDGKALHTLGALHVAGGEVGVYNNLKHSCATTHRERSQKKHYECRREREVAE